MLVLTRKNREAVAIGGGDSCEHLIKVTVLEILGSRVRLGFEADTKVAVYRWEVWETLLATRRTGGPMPPAA